MSDIRLVPVKSSNIAAVGYDEGTSTLAVQFTGAQSGLAEGRVYHYSDVPRSAFDALRNADSVGKHFAHNIRSKYKHKQV